MTDLVDMPKEGDLFKYSWGYDQTNVYYYVVVSVSASGKTAQLQRIGMRFVEHGLGYDMVEPDQYSRRGEPMRKVIRVYDGECYFTMDHGIAKRWSGTPDLENGTNWGR